MKKLYVLLITLISCFSLHAQNISPNTIGIRLGDSDGLGAEISYQRAIVNNTRIEAGLGWRNSENVDAFKLTGTYQWLWPIEGAFNWYVGGGGGIVSWSHDRLKEDGTTLFITGVIGVEYDFDFPLLLSLDARPELGFDRKYSDNLDLDVAIGVRYKF